MHSGTAWSSLNFYIQRCLSVCLFVCLLPVPVPKYCHQQAVSIKPKTGPICRPTADGRKKALLSPVQSKWGLPEVEKYGCK